MVDDRQEVVYTWKVLVDANKATKDIKGSKLGEQGDEGMLGTWLWLLNLRNPE